MAKNAKKGKGKGLWVILLLVLFLLGVGAYFILQKPGEPLAPETPPSSQETSAPEVLRQPVQPDSEPIAAEEGVSPERDETPPQTVEVPEQEIQEPAQENEEDTCEEIANGVRDFFRYLDERDYVQNLTRGTNTWTIFKNALHKLSAHPPVSAGEGLDPALMTKNIYHFFRSLDDRQILLAKEVIQNEADTLELNLDLFYRWLTTPDCPDPEGVRPSKEVLYKYAGFFMNTIGGRSYLFRRGMRLRLLVSYYSVLVLHEAETKGKNHDGIDIHPMVREVHYGMEIQPGLHFRDSYLKQLEEMDAYYQSRR